MIHMCESCTLPVLVYGRLVSIKFSFLWMNICVNFRQNIKKHKECRKGIERNKVIMSQKTSLKNKKRENNARIA